MKTKYPNHELIKELSVKHLSCTITDMEKIDLINHLREAYREYRDVKEAEHLIDTCESCIQSLGCRMPCDVREQLRHHIKCSEITLKGYRDYLHDMRVVTRDGKLYRGVPGDGFGGRWEMLYKHKTGDVWVDVQNYQIKIDLNRIAGSTGEEKTE